MALFLTCPCGKRLQIGDKLAGKQITCPVCTRELIAPTGADDRPARRKRAKAARQEAPAVHWPWIAGAAAAVLLLSVGVTFFALWANQAPPANTTAPIAAGPKPPEPKPAVPEPPPQRSTAREELPIKEPPPPVPDPVMPPKPKEPEPIEVYHYAPPFREGTPSKNVKIYQTDDGVPGMSVLGADGVIGFGREGAAMHLGVVVPGSTGLKVEVNRKLGFTNALGLRFKDEATLDLLADGVVRADRAGVNATDDKGTAYVSREVSVGGRTLIAMVKGGGASGAVVKVKPDPNPMAMPPEKEPMTTDPPPEPNPALKPVAEARRFEGHTGTVHGVALSRDGRRALSGGDDKTIRLWDVETGKLIRAFDPLPQPVNAVVFASDGKRALSGGNDGLVVLWNVETGKEVRRFKGHTGAVLCVAFSPSGPQAVSGGDDKSLRLWDLETGNEAHLFEGHESAVATVSFSPTGLWVFSTGQDGTARQWEVKTGKQLRSQPAPEKAGKVACWVDAGRVLSTIDKTLRLRDSGTGQEVRRLEAHEAGVTALTVSRDARLALSGGSDGTMYLWDLEAGTAVQSFTGHVKEVGCVAIAADGRRAVSGGADGTVRLWELPKVESAGTDKKPEGKKVEVYTWVPPLKVTGVSKNIQVYEEGNGTFTYTGTANGGELFVAEKPGGGNLPMPDALGSTNIRVAVNRQLGYTTLAGLQFKENATVNIGQDGSVQVNRAGVRAVHPATGDLYVSAEVAVGGRTKVVMVLSKRAP